MTAIRLSFLDVIPAPYRTPLYALLHRDPAYDIRVFFCSRSHEDRDWGRLELDFPHRFLHGLSLTTRRGNVLTYHFEPDVLRALVAPRPDALVVSGWAHPTFLLAAAAAKLARVPYLVNSESHGGKPRAAAARALRAAVFSPFVRGAAGGLAAGSLARDYLVELGASPESVFLLPNSCDVGSIERAVEASRAAGDAARLRAMLGEGPVVAYVGRLVGVKGVDVLLDALARLRETGREPVAAVVGDGPERRVLERRAGELGLERVRFLGSFTAEQVPAVYAVADVLCLPSRQEPWGVVVQEALAAGVPVVASDAVGAAADLVLPGETGALFPSGDADALACRLAEVLDAGRDRLGSRARQVARAWDYDFARAELGRALDHVLER